MRARTLFLIPSDEVGWADLRAAVARLPSLTLVGEATQSAAALAGVTRYRPDMVIAAAELDGESTLPLLAAVRERAPTSAIVIAAARFDPADLVALADLEIAGYLVFSQIHTTTLRHSLAAAVGGEVVVTSRPVAQAFFALTRCRLPTGTPLPTLTPRERALLKGLAAGLTRQQLAQREHLSLRTVDRVLGELRVKLDVPTTFVLAMKATQLGLIP